MKTKYTPYSIIKIIYTLIIKYKLDLFVFNYNILIFRLSYPFSYFDRRLNLIIESIDLFSIGKDSSISAFSTISVSNDSANDLNNSFLMIGNRTYIGEYNNIRAGGGTIWIGDDCLISQHITIVASNHSIDKSEVIRNQKWSTKNNFVIINNDVWIGANSVILPGVTIGQGAVIGAGSIVNTDIPDYAIVKGNPAQIVNYRLIKK